MPSRQKECRLNGVVPFDLLPARSRSPLEIAEENAVEGCVRETFGAALAMWQAEHANDPEVRSTMAGIADDEAEHSQLAWDIAAWLEPRLPEAEQKTVHHARSNAIAELRANLSQALTFASGLGLPDAAEATRLLDEVSRHVWVGGHLAHPSAGTLLGRQSA